MQPIKHTFTGGINADDSGDLLPANVYLNAENMRLGSSLYGQFGRMEAVESNRQIANPIAPTGANTPIGRKEDYARNRCFGFFFNSNGNHFIAVMQENETVLLVLVNSQVTGGLGFTNTPIHSIVVNGDLLIWVQSGVVRRINTEAALRLNNNTYPTTVTPYTAPLALTVTTLARKPVNYAPIVQKGIDTTVLVNQLDTDAFRFCYYYQYRDGEISTVSIQSVLVPGNFVAQALNAIDITLPFAERIEQDVQAVVLIAYFATDNKAVTIKTWNKDSTTDATAIATHNAGTTALTYRFTNTSFGETIDNAQFVKPFDHLWPCETIEEARNRLHYANIREGYNLPKRTSLTFTRRSQLGASGNVLLKTRSRYAGIMVFFDEFEKPIPAPEGSAILDMGEPGFIGGTNSYNRSGDWSVSNANALAEIPVEAKFYSVCMTKNLTAQFFLQADSPNVMYADTDASTGKYTFTSTTYTPGRTGIGVKATYLIGYGLGYTFQSGDIAKMRLDNPSNPNLYTLAVKGTQGDWIILEPQQIGILIANSGCQFEIYTPTDPSQYNNYYEVGLRFPVTNPGTTGRAYSTLSGSLPGDAYMVVRNTATTIGYFEAMNFNEKVWKEWNTSHGRLYLAGGTGQQVLKTGQRWSNKYLPGTAVNGLSSFDALDIIILPALLVSIQKLILTSKVQEEGNVMLAVGERAIESEYLGETQVVDSTSTAFIASSAATVGTTNTLRLSTGTKHPATIREKDGNVFGFDIQQGLVWQYSRAGLDLSSNRKMKQDWLTWSKAYIAQYGIVQNVVAGINEFSGEYQLSLPAVTGIGGAPWRMLDGVAKVVSYNYEQGVWSGCMLYQPQQMFYLNRRFYSITGSFFRCHDVSGRQVVLDGVTRPMRLMFISNGGAFDRTKIWETIALIGRQAPDSVRVESYLPYDQYSTLLRNEGDFELVEGKHYASFYNNQNDDVLSATAALLDGENLRGQELYILLEWLQLDGAVTKQNRIYVNSVHLGVTLSSGHTI